jgi:DNA-binding transcriptional LysR family regulator
MDHLKQFKFIDAIARAGSVRKASEILNISSTALNRRLIAFEEDFGVQVFERLPRGLVLSPAGELIIYHIRNQLSDHARLQLQISQLSGIRRGHVSISCSQAFLPQFLPEQIGLYRRLHQEVTFSVLLRDRDAAEIALLDHSADIAIVLEPVRFSIFHTETSITQPICCVMRAEHPLASKETIRLRDCVHYPVGLPNTNYGVRYLLDRALKRAELELSPVIESDSFEFLRHLPTHEDLLTFQIPIGKPRIIPTHLIYRPMDSRDVEACQVSIGYLRGRNLPIAAAAFLEQLVSALSEQLL